jgi:glycosyltransferase involved in cell wall biosynthesis
MKIVILQYRLFHYRMDLFDRMRTLALARGWQLHVVTGQAYGAELLKKDEGQLDWVDKVKNRYFPVAEKKDICWQPVPEHLRDADIIVFMQENRLLSNYWWIFKRRFFNGPRVAYWGHGRDFQTRAASGLRERWKAWSVNWVDWWFAYTSMTVEIVRGAGFAPDRITCLNNAIDVKRLARDWHGAAADAVVAARVRYGISDAQKVGIFCGSLYADKKLELMFAAADRVKAAIPAFVLIILGDGTLGDYVRQQTASRAWVHWDGVQRGVSKAIAFGLSSVMLNPGLVGLHILDAFSMGLPMITTRTAQHSPEIAYLDEGVNGLMVDESAEAYAEAVIAVFRDDLRLQAMRAAALLTAERYTVDAMAANFIDGLGNAVAQVPRAGA